MSFPRWAPCEHGPCLQCLSHQTRCCEKSRKLEPMTYKFDPRREQLEQLADEGDECALAELWQVYGVDRRP